MRVCSSCGRENDDDARYCEDCGKTVGEPSQSMDDPSVKAAKDAAGRHPVVSTTVNCPECGSGVVPGLPFCPTCGTQVSGEPKRGQKAQTSPFAAQRLDVRAELAVLEETGEVSDRHRIVQEETTIGREGATVEFSDDAFMSPLHAQLTLHDGQFFIRDLGSRNGTWLFLAEPYKLGDGDLILIGSQILLFRRLGYPGPHPPERDATRRMGSLVPSADIAKLIQLRSDGSYRDALHLSPGRNAGIGRERGDWIFPYDPSLSSLHAQIRSEDADFVIVDAGSRNGVGVSVRGEMPLVSGSRFLVGDKMLRLELL